MRTSWRRRVLVLGVVALTPLGVVRALANGHHWGRGVVMAPASFVEAAPAAYVEAYPTAYAWPTSYVLPTSPVYAPYDYSPTSYVLSGAYAYVAPTAYYPMVMRRRRRFYVERPVYATTAFTLPTAYSYAPSSVLYPTSYAATTAALASDPCCDPCAGSGSVAYSAAPRSTPPAAMQPATPSGETILKRPTPSTLQSTPANEPEPPSRGAGVGGTTTRDTAPPPNPVNASAGATNDGGFPTPPAGPAPEKEAGAAAPPVTPITPPSGGATSTPVPPARNKAPVAPGGGNSPDEPPQVGEAESILYQAKKPVFQAPAPFVRSARKGNLNVLEGKVVSSETGQPEEDVRVVVANRLQTFAERVGVTDAFGRFAVRVPDGDWTVQVTMPSGRVYAVSELVVSNGQFSDDLGRDVPTLTIKR